MFPIFHGKKYWNSDHKLLRPIGKDNWKTCNNAGYFGWLIRINPMILAVPQIIVTEFLKLLELFTYLWLTSLRFIHILLYELGVWPSTRLGPDRWDWTTSCSLLPGNKRVRRSQYYHSVIQDPGYNQSASLFIAESLYQELLSYEINDHIMVTISDTNNKFNFLQNNLCYLSCLSVTRLVYHNERSPLTQLTFYLNSLR